MDKNAIKKYAVWARRELISRVSQRAAQYEITAEGYGDQNAASVHGRLMSAEEKKQRSALIDQIKAKGYEQVMEEVAYTWFNRFSALRFMEVNGYLPSRIRVFTDDENNFKPQILAEAINMELDGLDMQKVYDLKNANDEDALFKYMIIVQCNALSGILPGMFQRISDYTELLFPDNLLRDGSVVEQMIAMIPQEDWTDQVQIIGWLYQYYNTEPKDQVFANLKKNIKITKENIPAATQLFTPDWIVQYMVENSLGRLWLEGHPNDDLKAEWKYYLDEAEQEPEVQAQLAEIRKEYAALKPEEILAIDPCQGSGHILAYMFDVLVQIYEAYGYSAREAATSIVEHNIWGLDIDERAAQLAYFSVMMKARQYDRRFLSRKDENDRPLVPQPHVYAIRESNDLDPHCIEYFVDGRAELKSAMDTLVKELHDAKEYGSILNVTQVDFDALYARFDEIRQEELPGIYSYQAIDTLLPFVQVAQTMAQKYHTVTTNPPYMGSNSMSPKLTNFVKKLYPDSKSDLFAVFIEVCARMLSRNGYRAMITQQGWMFVNSLEKLRLKVLELDFMNMAHLGSRAFEEISGEVVQTTAFVQRNNRIPGYKACFSRLISAASQDGKEKLFLSKESLYSADQSGFSSVPGHPIAYWVSDTFMGAFSKYKNLGSLVECAAGISTGDNDKYLKLWFEVDQNKIAKGVSSDEEFKESNYTYAYCNKGGGARKWYGNNEYVAKWSAAEEFHRNGATYKHLFFIPGITWSEICMGNFAARHYNGGQIFDHKSPGMFASDGDRQKIYLGLLNSIVVSSILNVINPTISTGADTLRKVPVANYEGNSTKILACVNESISSSKEDWDSFETSWDFKRHPLVPLAQELQDRLTSQFANERMKTFGLISWHYSRWEDISNGRFDALKENEEELNRIFIDIYGLGDELSPDVEDKDVTVRKADLQREIRSLISYAVGCMFGRYSLDTPGLIYAGGAWDASKYETFLPDKDAILPICDDEYFEDDIAGRFIKFVETVYGAATLEENLRFIADALGGKGSSREVIRNYFINDFYADHLKVYQKCPIYWLFDSGKKNGFKCLVYMHRYQPDTIARIRTDYVHEQQSRYRTAIVDLESRVATAGTGERVKLQKQLDGLRAQAEELRGYEEKIHHLADQMIKIDLDDGVKVNYAKFQDVLAKIK